MHELVLELAHTSQTAANFEQRLLSELSQRVGAEVGFFLVRGDESHPTTLGFDRKMLELFCERGAVYGGELMPVKRAALAARGVAVDTEVLGSQGVQRAAYFRELASKVGGRHSLLAYLGWQGRVVAALMLGRTGRTFSQRDVERIEQLLPTLSVARAAFGLGYRPSALRPKATGIRQWLRSGTRTLESRHTQDAELVVRERLGYREMVASQGSQGLIWTRTNIEDPRRSGWPYIDLFHVAAGLAQQRQRALFIGAGGAVALHQFASVYPGIDLDLVESETAVLDLARNWFALDRIPGLQVHVGDGVEFVERAPTGNWDVAIVDAFGAHGLGTGFDQRRFFTALSSSLSVGGSMAFNVVGTLNGRGIVHQVWAAASHAFSDLRLLPVVNNQEDDLASALRNVVLVGRRCDNKHEV